MDDLNYPLTEFPNCKLLGVTIYNNMSWSKHIKILSENVARETFQLSRIEHFLE